MLLAQMIKRVPEFQEFAKVPLSKQEASPAKRLVRQPIVKPPPACQFCGNRKEEFKEADKLDLHYVL